MQKFHSKIGNVFEFEAHPKTYLQLVHIDPIQMGSDVVVVYGDTSEPYDFYTHTTIEQGLQENLWHQINRTSMPVDLSELVFKVFMEDYFDEGIKPYWHYWTCADTEWRDIPLEEGRTKAAEEGGIYPASEVLYRIEHGGTSGFKNNWPT